MGQNQASGPHQFLSALLGTFIRLGNLRYELYRENQGGGFEFGQTASWGGADDSVHVLFGVWGRRADGSQIIWGIDVVSTPAELLVNATVEREDEDGTTELWRHSSAHPDATSARPAITHAIDLLTEQKGLLSAP